MGFFQELKEDLSQAVNELVPNDNLDTVEEYVADDKFDEDALFAAAEESLGIEHTTDVTEMIAASEEMDLSMSEYIDTPAEPVIESEPVANEVVIPEVPVIPEIVEEPVVEQVYEPEPEPVVEQTIEPEVSVDYVSDEIATITKMMTVNGDVVSNGSLDVIGAVNGNIQIKGSLSVTGIIKGNAEAAEIQAKGARIDGDLVSSGAIKVGTDTVIRGNIYATSAVIAGAIKGDIDVHGPVVLDSTAIVMGNIKSKAVQINNGAAIEGMCSQCYAEVSPSNFFRD